MIEQLWVVEGQHPVLWSLPMRVQISDGGADVKAWPAMELRAKEKKALNERMNDVNASYGDCWELTIFKLRKIGRQVPMDDPEVYAQWHRPHLRQQRKHYQILNQREIEAFTDALFQQGVGESREAVAFWWQTFRNHMLDWLLNKGRPLDLGFVRLHSSLRRSDWPERLASLLRRPKEGPAFFRQGNDCPMHGTRAQYLASKSFVRLMQYQTILRPYPNGACARWIEVEQLPAWRKLALKVESHRLKVLKGQNYAQSILAELKATVPLAAALAAERRGTRLALSAVILNSGVDGAKVIAPSRPIGSMSKEVIRSVVAAREAFHRQNDVRLSDRRKRKNVRMPGLRTFRQTATDLWNGGTYVPGLGKREDGNRGLLVRHGVQEPVSDRQLLEMGTLSERRLAG